MFDGLDQDATGSHWSGSYILVFVGRLSQLVSHHPG